MFAFAKKGKIACSRRQPFRGLSAKTQVEVRVVAPQPMRFDHKKTEVKLRLPGFRCNPFFFFRPTPCGFRQVVQHLSKHVSYEINYLIHAGADAVVAAKVNWKRTDT